MVEPQELTNNADVQFIIAESKRLSESISIDQAKLTLLRILYCLQSNQLTDKQAEDLFFNVTKTFQLMNKNLSALAILIISIIEPQVKSSFFVTRSLVQAYESNDSLKPAATRLISKVTNPSSISECQKLVKNSCMNKENKRLLSSAAVSSVIKQIGISENLLSQSNQIEDYNIFFGIKDNEKYQLQIKNCSSMIQMAIIDSLQNQQDIVKNIMQILPLKDAQVKWNDKALYLDCFKKLSTIQINFIKVYQQQILNSWAITMKNIQQQEDWYTIAMMRYMMRIYSSLSLIQNQFQVPQQFLEIISQIQQHSNNQSVRTTCLLLSIQNQFKQEDLQQLFNILEKIDPSQLNDVKEIIIQCCSKPELAQIIIQNSLQLIQSQNQQIKMIAIDSLTLVLNQDVNSDIKYSIIKQLLLQISNQTESSLFDQIIQVVSQLPLKEDQQKEINSLIFEYALLYDNDSAKQYLMTQQSQQVTEMNKLLQSDEVQFEEEQIDIPNFNIEQLIDQEEDFLNNVPIQFNKQKTQQSPIVQLQDTIMLNPNYKQYNKYHIGDTDVITPQESEVQVSVTKIFYSSQQKKEIMLIFQVDKNEAEEVNLIINKSLLKPQNNNYLLFIAVPPSGASSATISASNATQGTGNADSDASEAQQDTFLSLQAITDNKVTYIIDDEEETIKCQDIDVLPYDLTEQILIEDFKVKFESFEPQNMKFQLQDIKSAQEACETLSNNLNLYLEELQVEGKHCYCWLMGRNFQSGELAIIRCESKELKAGGVGVKLDFRGGWSQEVVSQI